MENTKVQSAITPLPAWENEDFLMDAAKYLLENKLSEKLTLVARRSLDEAKDDAVYLEMNYHGTKTTINLANA
uniref:Uncharacterized protein n=1 Tax=Panagrolaimus davidi TaxID=227884 RepID=A0A914PCI9_9BILA